MALFGLASMLIASTVPDNLIGLAGYCYTGLAVVMPVHGRIRGRQRRRLIAGAEPV